MVVLEVLIHARAWVATGGDEAFDFGAARHRAAGHGAICEGGGVGGIGEAGAVVVKVEAVGAVEVAVEAEAVANVEAR